MDIVSTDVSTIYDNKDNKKVKCKFDCYTLHVVILVIMLLFIIAIICYHYAKYNKNLKETYCCTKNIKMENNEFKVRIKNLTCHYFNDRIKFEDFDFDNILIDENSH